ncbi:hypothetical protein QBZ16_002378 [Prototheca wickerhamii]|uniref:Acetyl-CoA carboxylase n=1 Tax=Prototheca wickerhamii TaxID=3111 RepID=A0AAD9MMQ2_PROWI|nr:hypothetical protein QBZ16_002378 [Prototheca wickerhamii]
MTVANPPEAPFDSEGSSLAPDNGSSKPTKLSSTRSLLSISYRELSRSNQQSRSFTSRGVPGRTDVSDELERRILEWQGDRAIHSVLVANNGLAAVKFIRSIRSWSYKTFGNERAVKLIAMATPEDMRADAEHIRMADQFVEVPGGKNVQNYANVGLITSVAVRTGVDAVWPGWGHASEFPELPESLGATPSQIRFVGPPAGPMAALGDKVGSTILAQAAGVPTLAWSGSGVSIAYADCPRGEIPPEVYRRACIDSLEAALACCERIGYPVMLKASWGGGGKGIRKVLSAEEVKLAYTQVCGEVPGSPVFAMKLAPQSRHLEVQLLCDAHGQVCSLYSRDCSVQRRHQKVVEEGPVTAAPPEVLEGMERCARSLARAVGYVGAATVEYLYMVETQEYCFLELNPRLQVEHPVTEMITGVNIPAAQLLVAAGVPLHRIPDIRRLYRAPLAEDTPIDFEDDAARLPPNGHVLAVRVTAENAHDGFKPTSGAIEEISFRSTPDVWGYFSVKGGSAVHEFADSQFGHLFARGDSREAAVRAMVVALKEIKIRGEIQTPVDYVARMIQTDDFLGNRHHTGWLDARIAAQVGAERPPWFLVVIAGAVLRATRAVNERAAAFLDHLRKGQLPPSEVPLTRVAEEFVVDGTKYAVDVTRTGPQAYRDGGLLLQVDGRVHVLHSEEEALGTRLVIDSATCLLSNEHDPSQLVAVSTGKLVRHLVAEGEHVRADEPFAEVEVMKMMMTLLAPAAGAVRWEVAEGAALAPGLLLARLELDDPAAALAVVAPRLPAALAARLEAALAEGAAEMAGELSDDDEDAALRSRRRPRRARRPPRRALRPRAPALASAASEEARAALDPLLTPLLELTAAHAGGPEGHARRVARQLLERYLDVEERFESGGAKTDQEVIDGLRGTHSADPGKVLEIVVAHQSAGPRADLVHRLLNALVLPSPEAYRPILRRLAALTGAGSAAPAQRARRLLEHSLLGELRVLVARALSGLDMFSDAALRGLCLGESPGEPVSPRAELASALAAESSVASPTSRRSTLAEGLYVGLGNLAAAAASSVEARMAMLVEAPAAVDDALATLLDHPDPVLQRRALSTYVRRIYFPGVLHEPQVVGLGRRGSVAAVWAHAGARPGAPARHGGALVLAHLRAQTSMAGLAPGTLHVALTAEGAAALQLDAAAQAALGTLDVSGYVAPEHQQQPGLPDATVVAASAAAAVSALAPALREAGYNAVSFLTKRGGVEPLRVVFYDDVASGSAAASESSATHPPPSSGWSLDPVLGTVEPPTAEALELACLAGRAGASHDASRNRQWHMWTVAERAGKRSAVLRRTFLRGAVRSLGRPALLSAAYAGNGPALEQTVEAAAAELERLGKGRVGGASPDWTHAFFSVLSSLPLGAAEPREEGAVARAPAAGAAAIASRHVAALRRAALAQWEVCLRTGSGGASHREGGWRVVVSSPTGHEAGEAFVDVYRESADGTLRAVNPSLRAPGPLDGQSVLAPYPTLAPLQQRRLTARRHKTTYAYDFPGRLGATGLEAAREDLLPPGHRLVTAEELVLDTEEAIYENGAAHIRLTDRAPSMNDIGIVAWRLTLATPECPRGRAVVAIANDITYNSGSFGPREDAFFKAATEYALAERLPVVYLAANSGARVGLAEEVKRCLRVEWSVPGDPTKGFKYLYLDDEDYRSITGRAAGRTLPVSCSAKVDAAGRTRHVLHDVIGLEDGLGVECLSGSGAIAGAFARAFREGFTVTARRREQPIILTGFAALNKLLGREVYTSQQQLGGPRVMGANGVSHHVVDDDLQGLPPTLRAADPVDRRVTYAPGENEKLDPRLAVAGGDAPEAVTGLFDRGSWTEAQAGWAQTVVTGRARLGGIPVGVAGQVWFPDSALKTAQAIEEFGLEGLPLFILANWRGFSGGQRDLFEGVLQAGSQIVEMLRTYRRPVTVYLGPGCELRGGAWVVVDSQINPASIEMYADPTAQGAVLEPQGVVEIKFRTPDLLAAMHRLDEKIIALKSDDSPSALAAIKAREAELLPVYSQVAHQFAQMHDGPVRMLAKGVLRGIVPWSAARAFLATRLRRRLAEEALLRQIAAADASVEHADALAMLRSWFLSSPPTGGAPGAPGALGALLKESVVAPPDAGEAPLALWQDDLAFLDWSEAEAGASRVALELKTLRVNVAMRSVDRLCQTPEGTAGLVKGLDEAIKSNPSLLLCLRSLVKQ